MANRPDFTKLKKKDQEKAGHSNMPDFTKLDKDRVRQQLRGTPGRDLPGTLDEYQRPGRRTKERLLLQESQEHHPVKKAELQRRISETPESVDYPRYDIQRKNGMSTADRLWNTTSKTVTGGLRGTAADTTNLAGHSLDVLNRLSGWMLEHDDKVRADKDREVLAKYEQDYRDALAAGDTRAAATAQLRINSTKRRLETAGDATQQAVDFGQRNIEKVYDKADEYGERSQRDIQSAKDTAYGGKFGDIAVDAGSSLVQVFGDAAANTLIGAPASMVPFALRAYGGGTRQARQEGADLDKQALYGGAQAIKEVLTEKMFGVAGPWARAYGHGPVDDAIKNGIAKAVNRYAKTPGGARALSALLKTGASGITEGLEEFVGTWAEWQFPRIYGGDPATAEETLAESVYSFLVGGLSGLMGAPLDADTYRVDPVKGNPTAPEAPAPAVPTETASETETVEEEPGLREMALDEVFAAGRPTGAYEAMNDAAAEETERAAAGGLPAPLQALAAKVAQEQENAQQEAPVPGMEPVPNTVTELIEQKETEKVPAPAMPVEEAPDLSGIEDDSTDTPAVEEQEDLEDDPDERSIRAVADFTKTLGKAGQKTFTKFYGVEQNPAAYVKTMTAAYNAGKTGAPLDGAVEKDAYGNIIGAYPPQVEAAYIAGQADGKKQTASNKVEQGFEQAPEKSPAVVAENATTTATPAAEDLTVAEKPVETYNDGKEAQSGRMTPEELKETMTRTDELFSDGLRYSITLDSKNLKYYTKISRAQKFKYVEDARADIYSGGPFDTHEEAVDDIVGIASNPYNNLMPAAKKRAAEVSAESTEDVEKPEAKATAAETQQNEEPAADSQQENEKEEHDDGNRAPDTQDRALEEVSDGERVSEPVVHGEDAGRVLDERAPADVQEDEGTGDAPEEPGRGGREPGGSGGRPDSGRVSDRRSPGSDEGADVPTERRADGDVTEKPSEAATTADEIQQKEDLAVQVKPRGENFSFETSKVKIPTTPKQRFGANKAAIQTLRTVMSENRLATPEEQMILAKYTGWGGISEAFDERKADWAKEYKQLKKLLSEDEYKAARSTVTDAYYTDPAIIQGMYKGLAKLGFKGGRLLEPSSGIGRFMGAMPAEQLGGVVSWTAVEIDPITGNIAKYLYPNADVRVMGYQDAKLPDSYMDLAIGNVPFGNIRIADKRYPSNVTMSIHNYFIAKTLDKVRPGGVAALITTSATMDNDKAAREYFAKKADLIGAVRLPNTAFKGTGTNVVSDILFFKVREPGTKYSGEEFQTASYAQLGEGSFGIINEYFKNHPEMILGKARSTTNRWNGVSSTYDPLDTRLSLEKQIEKAIGKIKAQMDYPVRRTAEDIRAEIKADAGKIKEGGIVKKDGKLYQAKGGKLVETDFKGKNAEKISGIVGIRDAARSLLDLQVEGASESDIQASRKKLNDAYDAFVKKNGSLHKNKNLVHKDADAPFIMALEDYNKDTGTVKKAAIFTKNTVAASRTVTHADTVDEAITVIMNETGVLNPARVAQLTGQTAAEVKREMLDRRLAFLDRNGDLQTAEQYLSGNVRAKLKDAEALAQGNPDYVANVEELKKIIPADIEPEDIGVRMGATWVPDTVYSAFASEMLGGRQAATEYMKPSISVKYQPTVGKFFVEINDKWMKDRPENTTTWGTPDYPFVGGRANILDAALNNKTVSVYRSVGEERVLDKQATAAANEKLNIVLNEFREWLWKDSDRRKTLAPLYNDMFNNTVTPNYDGSHLTVAGSNPAMPMRPHQKNAVQRIINSGGNTLLAHRVGAGKTYEMAAAAMKLRQLGIVKKPLFTVPKHLVAQWGNEFLSYFPAAKILVLEDGDFTKSKRKEFANRIATGDYDAVIMSYEQFGMVPMSMENQKEFYQSQLDALDLAIAESSAASGRDPSIRDMERTKKNFEAKLQKLGDSKKDEDNIDFEQLGVDAVFVDEAHNFKNLYYITKMNNVSDLGDKEGSQRAFDLYMKVRYLQKLNGGRGIVFATATPVMNSVVELYTMQRYLQGDMLDARGLTNFDAWANQFGEVMPIRKMKPGGNGYDIRMSLSKYKNLGELQQMMRSFADVIVDPEDLPYLKIPEMKGGKRIVVECEPSQFQEHFMEELGHRAEALRGAGKGGQEDHIFKIMGDGDRISYTQRLIDPSLPYEEGGKVFQVVDNTYRVWKKTEDQKGTQLIFCDRGVPGGADAAKGINLYQDIKNLLVGKGIPADEIAFIHDADTDEKKDRLFKDVNEGKVRVLIGSSAKMGTGMNVQRRIFAIHEMNAPARPGDLEQNEGRALRQGNIFDAVEVYTYVTKKTFDSKKWDNLKRKAVFIHQVMAGDYTGREAAGDGDLALSAAEISAIASDNPLIIEQFEVSEKISNLEALERAHSKEQHAAEDRIAKTKKEIESDSTQLARMKKDLASKKDVSGDKFSIVVGKKYFADRKKGGSALIAIAKEHLNLSLVPEQTYPAGEFAGLELAVTSKGDYLLRGAAQYRGQINMEDPVATMMRLANTAEKISAAVTATEKRLEENKEALPKLEKAAKAPFARSEELSKARKRESEIIEELTPKKEQATESTVEESRDGNIGTAKQSGDIDTMPDIDASSTEGHPGEWRAKRIGGTEKAPRPLNEIVEQIHHDFGVQITTGHIRSRKHRGEYDRESMGIRTKEADKLPTISHELGHHLDNVYGMATHAPKAAREELQRHLSSSIKNAVPKSKWTREGIAEYTRWWLQNREKAQADCPEFTKFFLNTLSGKDAALMESLADEVNAYFSMTKTATSAIRRMDEGRPDARTWKEKLEDWAPAIYQSVFDSNHSIKIMEEAVGGDGSVYKRAINTAYADSAAGFLISGGDVYDLSQDNVSYVGPGLKYVLDGIDLRDRQTWMEFGEYLIVKHGPERKNEETGKMLDVFADERFNTPGWMARRQKELEEEHPEFVEASNRLYQYQTDILYTWAVNTGLVSRKTAKEWAERWAYYVPFNRFLPKQRGISSLKRGFANQDSGIKKARGSALPLVHPVENVMANLTKLVGAGSSNMVMVDLVKLAKKGHINASIMEKAKTPVKRDSFDMKKVKKELVENAEMLEVDNSILEQFTELVENLDDVMYQYKRGTFHKNNIVTVMIDGKAEYWKINDPELLSTLTHIGSRQLPAWVEAYGTLSRFVTSNITGNNLLWSVFSNSPRDLLTLFAYTKGKKPKELVHLVGGIGETYLDYLSENKGKMDRYYMEYLALGGGSMSAYSADRRLAKKAQQKLMGKHFDWWKPWEITAFFSDVIEMGPRFATYKAMRERGMSSQEAFYEAADITTNFRRGGWLSRDLNRIFPFFNANVQGIDKFVRWISVEDVKGPAKKKAIIHRTTMYMVASIFFAALGYAINHTDDDREKEYEQLSSFAKTSFFPLPKGDGTFFMIPKPRELAIPSSFFTLCMSRYFAGNEHAFDGFGEYVTSNMMPSAVEGALRAIPTADASQLLGSMGVLGTLSYLESNKDFLGRPIVSPSLEHLLPEKQYNERTSKVAKAIGHAYSFNPATPGGVSPQQIDFLGENILGGWWKGMRALFPVDPAERDLTMGIRNTWVKDSQYSTDLTNWLFNAAKLSEQEHNSYEEDMDKGITYKMDNNMASFVSKFNKLGKNERNTEYTRAARQSVLDMVAEYRKARDHNATSAVEKKVYDVVRKERDLNLLPSVVPTVVRDAKDVDHTLNSIRYAEYQTTYLAYYWGMVEKILDRASSDNKADTLSKIKRMARQEATDYILSKIGAPTEKNKFKGVDPARVVQYQVGVEDIDDRRETDEEYKESTSRQDAIIELIERMHLSDEASSTLYRSVYKSDTNNPWA